MARSKRGGFTLLEVMVAVLILAITMAAVFTSEVGSIHVAARARFLTTASLLARCKMGEIEELVLREGLPAVGTLETDECCEDGEVDGFECEWEISRVVLPDQTAVGEGEEGALPTAGIDPNAPSATGANVDQILSGEAMMGGGDPVTEMALQLAFPVLKPHIEEQVRRATVTVRWREGDREQSFDVVQYLVAEQPSPVLQQALNPAQAAGQPATADSTGASANDTAASAANSATRGQ